MGVISFLVHPYRPANLASKHLNTLYQATQIAISGQIRTCWERSNTVYRNANFLKPALLCWFSFIYIQLRTSGPPDCCSSMIVSIGPTRLSVSDSATLHRLPLGSRQKSFFFGSSSSSLRIALTQDSFLSGFLWLRTLFCLDCFDACFNVCGSASPHRFRLERLRDPPTSGLCSVCFGLLFF